MNLFNLYEIIWKRAVSSQIANAIIDQVSVNIESLDKNILFRANGSSIKFNGMLSVYQEAKDEDEINGEENNNLPKLTEKENLKLINW